MTMRAIRLVAIAGALLGSACTLGHTETPDLTGPSTFSTSLRVTATPDTLVLNGQQSVVIVEARDATGGALANLRVHLDTKVGGVVASCGRLSLTDVTTASDGRAGIVFTAPTLPLPLPECSGASQGITIVATPVGTNSQANNGSTASIRFLTPGSSAQTSVFAVNFSISPNPGSVGTAVSFSDAGSVSPGHTITGFHWDWSDGTTKNGSTVTHDFGSSGTHTVTLTITDDIGQSGSKSALVSIN
jgi:hypothetical protein